MKRVAILYHQHQEVARMTTGMIQSIFPTLPDENADDLLGVDTILGETYYCDEIEFIDERV